MKTKAIRPGNLLLLLAVLAVAGCNSSSADTNPAGTNPIAFQPAPEVRQAQPAPAEPAASPLPIVEPNLDFTPSPNLADLIKLARAGVSETLMLKFIQNTTGAFGLGAAEIIHLNDLGVSENIINAMMERDRAYATAPQTAPQSIAPAPTPAPAPETTIVEQQPTVIAAPAPVTVNYLYETLSPYGTWVEMDGYGRCWQPTVIAYQTDWQPYCDRGRWIFTDSGWYWASDYSWGNVAFHYGRWFNHPRRGWCWSPDTVWAPAWVSWRNNNDYCGWAPLPPHTHYRSGIGFTYYDRNVGFSFDFGLGADCYTFVPTSHFHDSHPNHHAVPRQQVTQIFNNTTVINNIVQGDNNTVINRGLTPEYIAAATHKPIKPVSAHDLAPHISLPHRNDNHDGNRDGNRINNPAITTRPSHKTPGATAINPVEPSSPSATPEPRPIRPATPAVNAPRPAMPATALAPVRSDKGIRQPQTPSQTPFAPADNNHRAEPARSRAPAVAWPTQRIPSATVPTTPAAPATSITRPQPAPDRSDKGIRQPQTPSQTPFTPADNNHRAEPARSRAPAVAWPTQRIPSAAITRPQPAPVINTPIIRTPIATPPPAFVAPPKQFIPADRGNSFPTDRDSAFRSRNPVQNQPAPTYTAPTPRPASPAFTPAPSAPPRYSAPAITQRAPEIRQQPQQAPPANVSRSEPQPRQDQTPANNRDRKDRNNH